MTLLFLYYIRGMPRLRQLFRWGTAGLGVVVAALVLAGLSMSPGVSAKAAT